MLFQSVAPLAADYNVMASGIRCRPQEMNAAVLPSPNVDGKTMLIATLVGRGVFKAIALIGAFVLMIAVWFWDALLLTVAADANLRLVKAVTSLLPLDWPSKVESALRILGADRALLLIEGVAAAKIIMLSLAYPFRRPRP